MRTESLDYAQVAAAVALYLQTVRGVPMAAVKAVRFPVYSGVGAAGSIAEVDENVERECRSAGDRQEGVRQTPAADYCI